jgi:plastocyanin
MNKLLVGILVSLPLLACSGGGESPSTAPAPTAAPAAAPVDPATLGSITGKVMLEGTAPKADTIQMGADPACAKMHPTPQTTEFVVTNADGTLQNVFVYIKEGLSAKFPVPSEPARIDQEGCIYKPHVFGMMAGQPLEITNSDSTLHNIHATPKNNPQFNIGQPVKGLKTTKTFNNPEVMVPFKCDVHKWMNAYVGVVSHPFYSVTREAGSFTLKDVPPGDYLIEAWHEKFGAQTQKVTLAAKEAKEIQFTFKAEGGATGGE